MTRKQMVDEHGDRLKYLVRLVIKHPSLDPNSITETLGLIPHVSWLVGTPRETPVGAPLSGMHDKSVWGYSSRIEGKKFFYDDVAKLITLLEPWSDFLSKIVDTKGTIDLIVHLPGDVNIGDILPWRDLGRLSALKVNFGVEVFPNFN